MLNKLGKAKVVADKTKYGVYVWEMPDGKWVGDDEGHYMLIPAVFGDAEKIKILKEADFYFIKALRDHGLYDKIWQAYAALLPVKTVGVMGDNRTYEHICLLRAITSEDGMTADFFDFPKGFMQSISNQIINNIRGINRVVYDITSKPPSTIELE